MSKIRKSAKGKKCLVRLPNICNHNDETTVCAHISRKGTSGMGMKPLDVASVRACSSCHDAIDGRLNTGLVGFELDSYILDALCRTLIEYQREGLL